jgi:5-aminolevulinate synthase
MEHLEELLASYPVTTPKIIVFESLYSMSGEISPIDKVCALAIKYGAMTYLDEVHSVGLYGPQGAGLAAAQGQSSLVDIIQGTLGKAYGVIGGYITAKPAIIDAIRSIAPGFIFTTSLPPAIAVAALVSIRKLRGIHGDNLRYMHQLASEITYNALVEAGVTASTAAKSSSNNWASKPHSHILPIHIGEANLCKKMARYLLEKFNIYVANINFPTVPHGHELFRITPSPAHLYSNIAEFSASNIDIDTNAGSLNNNTDLIDKLIQALIISAKEFGKLWS